VKKLIEKKKKKKIKKKKKKKKLKLKETVYAYETFGKRNNWKLTFRNL